MTLDTQGTAAVRACNFHLKSLRQLRSSLPRDVAQSVACAIIGSRLDYCNSLYCGMSNTNFQRLQRVQNAAARIVRQAPRHQHSTSLSRPTKGSSLATCAWQSWLQNCRTLLQSRRTVTNFGSYFSTLAIYTVACPVLRSSTSDLLSTQSSSTNIAAHWFSCCAPTVWNSLPSFVRTADSFTSFRSQLKTYMFARHL